MISSSKTGLQRQVEIFLANAIDPEMQAILEQSGCDAPFLDQGQSLLQTWLASEVLAGSLNGEKKAATKMQHKAQRAARREIVRLGRMIRGEFGRDEALLTKLGLQPRSKATSNGHHSETNGIDAPTDGHYPDSNAAVTVTNGRSDQSNGNGQKRSAPKGSYALAAEIARGQRLCAAIATLSEEEQNRLATVGWSAERIQETAALIEAVAEADNAQQKAIQVKRAAVAEAQNNKKRLRRWFQRAVRLAKAAVDQHDPHDRENWLTRLGQ